MLSKEILKEVKGNTCFWCREPMLAIPMDKERRLPKEQRYKIKTMDHLIARSQGGGAFCVSSCTRCNSLKGSMHPREFREKHRPQVDADLLERLIEHATRMMPAFKKQKQKEYHEGVYLQGYSAKQP